MIYFLHCSARMSVCHSYVAVAVAASLQMGLHRSVTAGLDPIERETRKRVFWTVRNMETYICAILGLPTMMHDEDIDQDMPAEVDDEYITRDGILPQPDDRLPAAMAMNAYTKLVQIFAKVIRYVYPVKNVASTTAGPPTGCYRVRYSRVHEVEQDLRAWSENLPWVLSESDDRSPHDLR